MALTSHSSSGSVEGKNGVGDTRRSVQVNKVFWKASNPRGFRLQKLMSDDHLAGMLNAVENAFQIGQRAYDKKLQQGFRLTKFCRIELPNAWQWKSRQTSRGIHQQKPLGTAVLSTRYSIVSVSICIVLISYWKYEVLSCTTDYFTSYSGLEDF